MLKKEQLTMIGRHRDGVPGAESWWMGWISTDGSGHWAGTATWWMAGAQAAASLLSDPCSSQQPGWAFYSTRLSLVGLKVSVTPRALGLYPKALGQFGRLPVWTQACALSYLVPLKWPLSFTPTKLSLTLGLLFRLFSLMEVSFPLLTPCFSDWCFFIPSG